MKKTSKHSATRKVVRSPRKAVMPASGSSSAQLLALVITLDHVEPGCYLGWKGQLPAAASDRSNMVPLLADAGFTVTDLRNEMATRQGVQAALADLRMRAAAGDLVVIYFSGHGATLPNLNGDWEPSGRDQAWCLSDGMFVDDEIAAALLGFREGVRVVVVSDSCFTGSIVVRFLLEQRRVTERLESSKRSKLAPVDIGDLVFKRQPRYQEILSRPSVNLDHAKAAVILLAACADDFLAYCDDDGSVFTKALVAVWAEGRFNGTYAKLFSDIKSRMSTVKPEQRPENQLKGMQPQKTFDKDLAFRR